MTFSRRLYIFISIVLASEGVSAQQADQEHDKYKTIIAGPEYNRANSWQ
jgi:hypothetical protein